MTIKSISSSSSVKEVIATGLLCLLVANLGWATIEAPFSHGSTRMLNVPGNRSFVLEGANGGVKVRRKVESGGRVSVGAQLSLRRIRTSVEMRHLERHGGLQRRAKVTAMA